MYQGNSSGTIKKTKRKSLIIALVTAAIVSATAGTTIAYLTHSSNSVINSFSPSEITCSVVETVEEGIKSSVTVQNTGKTQAYIRVAVIANSLNSDGAIIGAADISSSLAGEGWIKDGNYYYYTIPVAPYDPDEPESSYTGELLNNPIDLDGLQVTILAEAIQSEPSDAAKWAWGVSPDSLAQD